MKKILIPFSFLLMCISVMTILVACGSDDEDETTSSDVDSRFVGTWVRDESVSNVVEQVYTLVLNSNGSASYSWYRNPKSSSVKSSNHSSSGTWRYDGSTNRIITDCTTSATGSTVILDVVNVTSTTLVVKQEGSSKSRTYTKK